MEINEIDENILKIIFERERSEGKILKIENLSIKNDLIRFNVVYQDIIPNDIRTNEFFVYVFTYKKLSRTIKHEQREEKLKRILE